MMKEIKRYKHYINRKCPLCNSEEDESLGTISGKRKGRKRDHYIENQVCICRKCGFVYTNPVIQQEEMNEYYQDMLTVYEPESDYSIDKRLSLIKKYMQDSKVIIELGGNEQGIFKHILEGMFSKYISADINDSAANTENSIKGIKNVADMLVSYFVLEHIIDIEDFLADCHKSLRENGVFIIEVPDASRYYYEISGLNYIEHVNHFTPESLTKLMQKSGFELIETSRHCASRGFGFSGVYRKGSPQIESDFHDRNSYIIMKSYLIEGMYKVEQSKNRLNEIASELKSLMTQEGGAFWCANEVLRSIIEMMGSDLKEKFLIIDQDVRKRQFYQEFQTETAEEAWKNGKLKKVEHLVICSENRVESIVGTLKEKYKEAYICMTIYYIDKNWNLKCYKTK